ncbi:MAG: ATP-binding protein [Candidatus Aenigmarchaeota archaeon]|nr:ATP-binding protein [Candidatus Aenigmarchaeota archaeon]
MYQEIFAQNPWWKDKNLIEEDYDIVKWKEKTHKWEPEIIEKINLEPFSFHIISGPRQAGKTTALKLLIRKLLGITDPKSVFYFNCESLADYKELLEVLDAYLEFKPKNSVILLDEITMPKEWYRAIKSLIDRGKFRDDVLIITGSTSIAVKREVELFPGRRGHGKDFIMYPLSFRGFVKVVGPDLAKRIQPIDKIGEIGERALNALMFEKELNRHLETYMEYGGFPLSVANLHNSKEEAKRTYLSWIKNAVLKAGRSDILARQIIKVLVETLQTNVSWEGISKKIEVKSPKTVAAYVDLLESIFVVNVLYNIDANSKKIRFGKNKKVHFRDPLLLEMLEEWCLVESENKKSAIAEALAVEHLTRAFPDRVFFWKNGFEIDVVVLEKGKLYGFEVKWSEKTDAKSISQLKDFIVITKKEYSKKPLKIPLSVFLSLFDV